MAVSDPDASGSLGLGYARRAGLLLRIAHAIGWLLTGYCLVQEQRLSTQLTESQPPHTARVKPIQWLDCFRGIALPPVQSARDVEYARWPDGEVLRLDADWPLAGDHCPIVVAIHGGSWQQGSTTEEAKFRHYLAARGYAVFSIDYRRAPKYQFPAQLDDVKQALQFIRSHAAEYRARPDRLALVGWSAGAHLALLAAYDNESTTTVNSVISYYGPTDLIRGYEQVPHPDPLDVRAILRAFTGGTPETRAEVYRTGSPVAYVQSARLLPPTLLLHGGRDNIVEPVFAAELEQRLTAVGATVKRVELPWAEHGFDVVFNGPGSQIALYETERWLSKTLWPDGR